MNTYAHLCYIIEVAAREAHIAYHYAHPDEPEKRAQAIDSRIRDGVSRVAHLLGIEFDLDGNILEA